MKGGSEQNIFTNHRQLIRRLFTDDKLLVRSELNKFRNLRTAGDRGCVADQPQRFLNLNEIPNRYWIVDTEFQRFSALPANHLAGLLNYRA